MSTMTSTHSTFASSSPVPAAAGRTMRMRALFDSTGLKSATCAEYPRYPGEERLMTLHTRALLAEAAGTFMFFFIGAGAIVATVAGGGGGDAIGAVAFAHGLALAIAVSAFGALSGGHFNPAVTIGLAVAGKHPWPRVPTYWLAQLIGALVAGYALRYVFDFAPTALDRT